MPYIDEARLLSPKMVKTLLENAFQEGCQKGSHGFEESMTSIWVDMYAQMSSQAHQGVPPRQQFDQTVTSIPHTPRSAASEAYSVFLGDEQVEVMYDENQQRTLDPNLAKAIKRGGKLHVLEPDEELAVRFA